MSTPVLPIYANGERRIRCVAESGCESAEVEFTVRGWFSPRVECACMLGSAGTGDIPTMSNGGGDEVLLVMFDQRR